MQREVQLFIIKIEQKEKEQEQYILQVKQFHIVNILNLLWQVFTIIRFVITIFFFLFLWILCISKERMKSIRQRILCCYKQAEDADLRQREEEKSLSFTEITDENISNISL